MRLLLRINKLVSRAEALIKRTEKGLACSASPLSIEKDGNYPPKLSYMIDSGSTPSESSIETTAADMGPGPHM